ncbi:MAG: hypothetical protein LBS74_09930 [Oscillospiraceae bacterium]|nr:hypothetical protein [Oscillospiraceae bacterium]
MFNKFYKISISMILTLMLLVPLFCFTTQAVSAVTDDYQPRPAKDGRTAYLHGDFTSTLGSTDIIVVPSSKSGKSYTTVNVGGNSHSSTGAWDSIEMDCFDKERGYYKTTLALKSGSYKFKIEQLNSAGIKDYWYGLDGYMTTYGNPFNGNSDADINLSLKHDDLVSFYFIDGDLSSFEEWLPRPPHTTENQSGTRFHLVNVSTRLKNNLNGLPVGDGNNIFDNSTSSSWRVRTPMTPIWYSITQALPNGEIGESDVNVNTQAELFLFRRTQVGESADGKWQVDNDKTDPALDRSSYYWNNAGAFFSDADNFPKLSLTTPLNKQESLALPYAEDALQPRHEEGANNIVFKAGRSISNAGVYSYFMDETNLDGTQTDDAQGFVKYPREPLQAVFLPSIKLESASYGGTAEAEITLRGTIGGANKDDSALNQICVLLSTTADAEDTAAINALIDRGFVYDSANGKYKRLYSAEVINNGASWELNLVEGLPKGEYEILAFVDVTTPNLINTNARNYSNSIYQGDNGVSDACATVDSYAGQVYLSDFIDSVQPDAAIGKYTVDGDFFTELNGLAARIYETDQQNTVRDLGEGVATDTLTNVTHTRSTVKSAALSVDEKAGGNEEDKEDEKDEGEEEVPNTGDRPIAATILILFAAGALSCLTLIKRKKILG